MDWTRGSWRHRTSRKRPAAGLVQRVRTTLAGAAVSRVMGRFAVLLLRIGTCVGLWLRAGMLAGPWLGNGVFAVLRGRILPR